MLAACWFNILALDHLENKYYRKSYGGSTVN